MRFPRHPPLWAAVSRQMAGHDLAHDLDHVLRVYRWALTLADAEGVDGDLCGAAGLMHDLVHIPKHHRDRPLGGRLSAIAGAAPLAAAGYAPAEVAEIVDAVRTSSWSAGLAPTGPVGAVLQDADRLDAIGAIGAARCFATAQAMAAGGRGGRFYDPADPLAEASRALDDRHNALDHWRIKLLRLSDGFHTAAGRVEAARRHAFLESFMNELRAELIPPGTLPVGGGPSRA